MHLSSPMIARHVEMVSLARSCLLMLGIVAITPRLAAPAQAHMRGMYATRAEAEKRAAELKCKGTFAMGTMWMPCANERALHDALQWEQ